MIPHVLPTIDIIDMHSPFRISSYKLSTSKGKQQCWLTQLWFQSASFIAMQTLMGLLQGSEFFSYGTTWKSKCVRHNLPASLT